MTLLAAGGAWAQQAPCRSYYRSGEYVPPACGARAPVYQSWNGGFGSTAAAPSGVPAAPRSHPDWRYFGGYNALYGFGR